MRRLRASARQICFISSPHGIVFAMAVVPLSPVGSVPARCSGEPSSSNASTPELMPTAHLAHPLLQLGLGSHQELDFAVKDLVFGIVESQEQLPDCFLDQLSLGIGRFPGNCR